CWSRLGGLVPRFLIKPNHIPAGITEAGRNLRRITTDRLHDLAAIRDDRVHRDCDAVYHDVEEQAGVRRRCPAQDPGTAYLAGGVIERNRAIAALSQLPTKHRRVKC